MKTRIGFATLALASLFVVSVAVVAAIPELSKSDSAVLTIKSKGTPVVVMTLKFPGVHSGAYPEFKADHVAVDPTTGVQTYSGNVTLRVHGVDQKVFELKADEMLVQTPAP